MDKRTVLSLLQQASSEITHLRKRVEILEPKAHAYDTIAQIANLSQHDRGGYASVDVNYELKTYIQALENEKED